METLGINYDTLCDIIDGKTGNPLAEAELLRLLKQAIEKGGAVYVELEGRRGRLGLDGGRFIFTAPTEP